MEPCIPPYDLDNWQSTPVIEGRAATEDDIRDCLAAFVMPAGQTRAQTVIALPALALTGHALAAEFADDTPVIVIQIEKDSRSGLVIAGFIGPGGIYGVTRLDELEIVETVR